MALIIPADFYSYVLPFLFVLAISYFVLSMVIKEEKHTSARALLAIVLAFLVFPFGPQLGAFLSEMGLALAVLITIGLVAIVFLAALGHDVKVFEKHSIYLVPIALVIAGLVFIAAGGLELLGLQSIVQTVDFSWMIMIGVIIIAVWILAVEPKGKKE